MAALSAKQQPAAEVAERVTEGGDEVVLGGSATSTSSESLKMMPPQKPTPATE